MSKMDIMFQKVILIHYTFKNVPKRLQLWQLLFKLENKLQGKKKIYVTEWQFAQMDSSLFVSQNASETFIEGRNRDANPQLGLLLQISEDTETLLTSERSPTVDREMSSCGSLLPPANTCEASKNMSI